MGYSDYTKADHNLMGVGCEPELLPYHDPLGPMKGPFSMVPRCFIGKNANQYAFEHNLDFVQKYTDKRKYSMGYLMDGHEFTTLLAILGDELFLDYFKTLEKKGILDDSLFIMLSDHG